MELILDKRDLPEIEEKEKELARSYTPEWRFGDPSRDLGAALARIYAGMYKEMLYRYNHIPDRLYVDFLNRIGYKIPGPSVAKGTIQVTVAAQLEESVPIPKGARLSARNEAGETHFYTVAESVEAVSARLEKIIYVSSSGDYFDKRSPEEEQLFFAPQGENLQEHWFSFGENRVLALPCPCSVTVVPEAQTQYMEEQTVRELAGKEWFYIHEGKEIPFDEIRFDFRQLTLIKNNSLSMDPDEEGRILIVCRGLPSEEIRLKHLWLYSAPLSSLTAGCICAGEGMLGEGENGYPMGRRPGPSELFYIWSDTVFSKRGARVDLCLDIVSLADDPPPRGVEYNFSGAIINKESIEEKIPDDVSITRVVWEYFNGRGWRSFPVEGKNPFGRNADGEMHLYFTVPGDLEPVEVDAVEGLFIRARVLEIENLYSSFQRWIVPFLHSISLSWIYEKQVHAEYAFSVNNGRRVEGGAGQSDMNFPALVPMESGPDQMLLMFDRPFQALPLSVRIAVQGRGYKEEKLRFSMMSPSAEQDTPLNAVDRTDGLTHTGAMLFYISRPPCMMELFGETGVFLKLERTSYQPLNGILVSSVNINTADVSEENAQPEITGSVSGYEPGKTVLLPGTPVTRTEVFVDESGVISESEIKLLAEESPDSIEAAYDDMVMKSCFVRYSRADDLLFYGPSDRVYTLDPYEGKIVFGDGVHGKALPEGAQAYRIRYWTGGGAGANLKEGSINGFVDAVPGVTGVTNITPVLGGTDRFSMERIRALGSRGLVNRGRAASARDFEELVLSAFPEVELVRCFAGKGAMEEELPGHVTVVVAGRRSFPAGNELCGRILRFLEKRADCVLTAGEGLSVVPAHELSVNTRVQVRIRDLSAAAIVQREVENAVKNVIEDSWRKRPIGFQIRISEIMMAVRQTRGVVRLSGLQAEGEYRFDGKKKLLPLEKDTSLLYAVVRSGTHTVGIES